MATKKAARELGALPVPSWTASGSRRIPRDVCRPLATDRTEMGACSTCRSSGGEIPETLRHTPHD